MKTMHSYILRNGSILRDLCAGKGKSSVKWSLWRQDIKNVDLFAATYPFELNKIVMKVIKNQLIFLIWVDDFS